MQALSWLDKEYGPFGMKSATAGAKEFSTKKYKGSKILHHQK